MKTLTHSFLLKLGLAAALSVCFFSARAQTVVATDGDVPRTMDAGGSAGNPAQYIVGYTGAYNGFVMQSSVSLGSSNDYNEFIVRNGSTFGMSMIYGYQSDLPVGSNYNSIKVTGANSELLVHYHSNGVVYTSSNTTGNTINVSEGGFFQMGDFNIGTNSTANLIEVDGTDSVFQTRYTVDVASGGELATTIANGGVVTVANYSAVDDNLVMTINDGGTLILRSTQDLNEFSTFTINSGGTLNGYNTLSNLAPISAGQTVDLTRILSGTNTTTGSFATATALTGGTVKVADFNFATANLTFTSGTLNVAGALTNYSSAANQTLHLNSDGSWDAGDSPIFGGDVNLTGGALSVQAFDASQLASFTSGTLNASGALSNLPTLSSGLVVDLTSGGSFGNATTLNGGTVKVADFNLATDNLTFTSGTLDTSGTLMIGSDNSTQTLSGVIAGSGALNKSGTGTLTLSGTNTYSGGTTVAAGILAGTTNSLQGDITNNASLVFDQSTTGTFGGDISGTGALAKSGSGTVTLTGNNTYSGGTTISAGILSATNANLGSGAVTLDGGSLSTTTYDAALLTFTSGTLNVAGALTNYSSAANQALHLNSGGSWDAGDSPTFGGDVNLTGGALSVQAFDASQLASFTSGTLNVAGALTNYSSASNQTLYLNSGGSWDAGDDPTFGGNVNLTGGALSVQAFDASQLASFTSGTLNVAGALTNYSSASNQTLHLNSGGSWDAGDDPTFGGDVNLTGGALSVQAFDASQLASFTSGTLNVAGVLTNYSSASNQTLHLNSGGSWDAGDDPTFGDFNLTGGALSVQAFDASQLASFTSGTLNVAGALTNYSSAANQTLHLNSGGSWDAGDDPTFGGDVNLTGGVLSVQAFDASQLASFTSGTLDISGTLMIGSDNSTQTLSGVIAGSGALNKSGTGTLTLSGSSTYSGGTTVAAGILAGTTNSLQGDITNNASLVFDQSTTGTFGGDISGTGTLAKSGSGTVTLTGNNTYSGGTTISAGTFSATNANLGSGAVTLDGGSLSTTTYDATLLTPTSGTLSASGSLTNVPTIGSNFTVDLTSGGSFGNATTLNGGTIQVADFNLATDNLTFTSGTLDTSGTLTIGSDDSTQTLSGVISGSGALNKSGTGTLTLSGTSTFSGDTTINQGTLAVSGTGHINSFADTRVGLSNGDDATLTINSGGSVQSQRGFVGRLAGSTGTVTVDGSWGIQDIIRVGDQGTGELTIQNGGTVLNVGHGSIGYAQGSIGTVAVMGEWTNSGDMRVGASGHGTLTIGSLGDVFTAGDATIGYQSSGDGTVDVSGSWRNVGDLYVGQSGVGNLTITSGGKATSEFGLIGDLAGSNGEVTVDGKWTMRAASRVGDEGTGSLSIQSGGEVLNTIGNIGYQSSGSGTVDVEGIWSNSGEVRIGRFGVGTLNLLGGGEVIVAASGGIQIGVKSGSTGILNLGEGGSIGIVNASQINGGDGSATLNFNHNWSITGFYLTDDGTSGGDAVALSGSLAVNHIGAGITTLSGTNTYTGGTTISNGTLNVASSAALPGSVTVNGGSLFVDGDYDASNLTLTSGSFSLNGTASNLAAISSGMEVRLSGDGALQTDTTLDGGTLNVESMNSTLTLSSGAGLDGNGSVQGDVSLGTDGAIAGDATGLTVFGRLSGSGTLSNVSVIGTLAPGNSPGVMNVTGDHEFTAPSTTEMELAGSGGVAGTDFDQFNVSGTLTLGGTLNIIPFSAYELVGGNTYDLFNAGTFTGDFASVSVYGTDLSLSSNEWTGQTASLAYTFSQASGDLSVSAIPEPGTILMFACFGLAAVIGLRRR